MFKQMVNLESDAHADLRFTPNQPYEFAAGLMMIPVLASELEHVAREMPVVFVRDNDTPQALVGVRPGENVHVRDSGHWVGRYIPAHIRRYPFALAEIRSGNGNNAPEERQYAVQFDAMARHFEDPYGHALLDEQGQPTPLLRNIQKILMGLEKDQLRTRQLVAQLEQADLLVERQITVNQAGTKQTLSGMRLLDDQALAKLDGEALVALRDSGALALAFAHRLSLTNLQDGLIAQGSSEPDTTSGLGSLFSDDDGGLNFDFDS